LQELAQSEARAQQGLARVQDSSKTSAYQAWLGFYNSYKSKLRWTPEHLVQQANYFSQTIGEMQP
jgi:ATP-dependent RNA helicase MSS116